MAQADINPKDPVIEVHDLVTYFGRRRILDKVDALKGGSLHTRPKLRGWDWCVMLGRALVM